MSFQSQKQISVVVANGAKISNLGICQNVDFCVTDQTFCADFIVSPLDVFDMVLGIKWLQTLGPIVWDFSSLTMGVQIRAQSLVLQGHQCFNSVHMHLLQKSTPSATALSKLLANFEDLFQEPSGLPPLRSCDHRILLLPGIGSIMVWPYRYPHLQKDEIERQCDRMLQQGIIRPSRSPFSSLVL